MALLRYSAPWTFQPQEAVELDRDGLGKGVQMLLMPMGGTLVDLVNPQQVWTPSGNAAIEPSTGGMAAALDGADDFWSATGYPNITGNVGTFFLWCPEIGSPDGYGHVWFGTNTTSALWFQVYPTASNAAAAFGQDITGIGVGSSIFSSTNTALAWSSDGTAAGKRFFFNGTSYGTPNGTAPTAFASGTKNVRFGAWIGGNSWDCSGKAVIAGFTTDVWTAEHARLFYENPWRLFAPQSLWVPVSAGAGSSTNLTLQDESHAHTLDAAVLTTSTALAVQNMTHGHALDAATLSTGTALAVADSVHAHNLDGVTLSTTGAVSLTVADSLHTHTMDAPGLTSDTSLAAADMTHGHALDGVTLTLGGINLVIADIMHAHAIDAAALTLDTYLAVADLLHAHAIDNVLVSIPGGTLDLILKILVNRQELNPATGTFTLYDDDGTTVLYTTSAWADAAGTVPYSGGALRRIDALF